MRGLLAELTLQNVAPGHFYALSWTLSRRRSNCPVAADNPFECPLTQMWVFILNMKTFIANNSDLIKGTC